MGLNGTWVNGDNRGSALARTERLRYRDGKRRRKGFPRLASPFRSRTGELFLGGLRDRSGLGGPLADSPRLEGKISDVRKGLVRP